MATIASVAARAMARLSLPTICRVYSKKDSHPNRKKKQFRHWTCLVLPTPSAAIGGSIWATREGAGRGAVFFAAFDDPLATMNLCANRRVA